MNTNPHLLLPSLPTRLAFGFLALLFLSPSARADDLTITGSVKAPSGYAISHVEVGLRRTGESLAALSTRSDDNGVFTLTLDPELSRNLEAEPTGFEIIATYPGFDPVLLGLNPDLLAGPIALTMSVSRIQESITVEALLPTDEALQPTQDFDFLDIVATAGTNADPMFATQTMPGVVKLDEGSGLFVRGGDASEVATFLDLALLDHPYRNETPTGGFFGTVDAFELAGLNLASGGFPARYGNALSAVLKLDTRDPTPNLAFDLGIGLAAFSASIEAPLGDNTTMRLAGNRRDAQAMIDLNGTELDFDKPPSGTDLSGRLVFAPTDRQRLYLTAYRQRSSLGTEVENGNFAGVLDTADDNDVANLGWRRTLGQAGSELELTLTDARHGSTIAAGVLAIALEDETQRARLDFTTPLAGSGSRLASWTLRTGGVYATTDHLSEGTLPEVGGDFGGDRGIRLWSVNTEQRRSGGYLELERPIGERLAINLGARYDTFDRPDRSSVDPRVSLSLRTGARSHLRLAWGRYHQSPEIEYLNEYENATTATDVTFADPRGLRLPVAEHRIVSWQIGSSSNPLELRLEAYDKRYEDLPLEIPSDRPEGAWGSDGQGRAKGADLYLGFRTDTGHPHAALRGWNGFVAYTYLDAERLYTPWQDQGRYDIPTKPFEPDFAIPHSLQLVLRKPLPFEIEASIGYRYATGRPYTPVLAATRIDLDSGEFYWSPQYDPINSDRLPDYQRVDLSASRGFALGSSMSALVYLGINDLLDARNAFRYVYSEDWSERSEARTAFGRTFYFGVSLRR